jgi:hypothetical protein
MNQFNDERFLALSESDLYTYVEPFLNPRIPIPQGVLQRMLADMAVYDESHLVYAIELGPDRDPASFASVLPQYLSHRSQSVRAAVSRALSRLPNEWITRELVGSLQGALTACPEGKHLGLLLDDLQARIST